MEEYFLFFGCQNSNLLDLLKEVPGFENNSYPIEDEFGLASYGSDSYLISVDWFNSVKPNMPNELADISEPPVGVSESEWRYIVVTWPDSQDLMELYNFEGNSILINDEKGYDDFGSSAYFVRKSWYEEMTKCSENCTPNSKCSCCGDNRFEIIEAAKKDLLKSTNIESDPDEMKVIDSILFRCWQMGWLGIYDNKNEKGS